MAQNKTPRRLSHIGFSSQRDVFQATQLDEMSGPEVADEIEEDVEVATLLRWRFLDFFVELILFWEGGCVQSPPTAITT